MSNVPDDLADFVKAALARGVPREDIQAVLLKAGWTAGQSRSALDSFAALDFPIPVPRPRPSVDARDAFLYLIVFAALYMSAYHLGDLLFDIINAAFPDPAEPAEMPSYRRRLPMY